MVPINCTTTITVHNQVQAVDHIRNARTLSLASLVLVAMVVPAAAQHFQEPVDSASIDRIIIVDPGISLGTATLLLPPSLAWDSSFTTSSLFFSQMPAVTPPFLDGFVETKIDLLSPLRLQWEREEKLKTLRMVLGTVQAGGAAYVAYRHLKKYGFLKKR